VYGRRSGVIVASNDGRIVSDRVTHAMYAERYFEFLSWSD
jgi:hypothetical protein